MSILPQDNTRKVSTESHETSKNAKSSREPQQFKKLMKVTAIDDAPQERSFFALLEEEEEEKPVGEVPYPTAPLLQTPLTAQLLLACSVVDAPAVEALFEKMAASMIVMSSSGETETTLFLDNPHFASSIFFGSQITIREFSTAPKAFNVEITAPPAAVACLDAGKQGLLSAFEKGNFNFSVHRIETHIQHEERPVFHRKENSDRDPQDQQGGRQR